MTVAAGPMRGPGPGRRSRPAMDVRVTPRGAVVAARWEPRSRDLVATADDEAPGPGTALYYLRVRQTSEYRGRAVFGWSSPVWVDPPASADQ